MAKKISPNNKGGAPNQHWEMNYELNPRGKDKKNPQNAWDPKCAYEREKLYNKVNETDH